MDELSKAAAELKYRLAEAQKKANRYETQDLLGRFRDEENGGFYLYGAENEALILRPKETYDGAIPSGNSLMAWNLVRLSQLKPDGVYAREAERQLEFLAAEAGHYPTGYAMFLLALLDHETPPPKVTVVLAGQTDAEKLPLTISPDTVVLMLQGPTEEYPLKNGKTAIFRRNPFRNNAIARG